MLRCLRPCSLSDVICYVSGRGACAAICVRLHKACPHLLYLEAGADHLAGDRGLVCFLDCLRHGCDTRGARASRAVVTAVLRVCGYF